MHVSRAPRPEPQRKSSCTENSAQCATPRDGGVVQNRVSQVGIPFSANSYSASMVGRVLFDLGLPFLTFNQFGRLIEASPIAEQMLGRSELPRVEIACQAIVRRVVAERCRTGHCRDDNSRGAFTAQIGAVSVSIRALPPGDAERIAIGVLASAPTPENSDTAVLNVLSVLTPREREVARLLASGASTKAISHALGRSIHTVRRHTDRIFAKTGVGSRAQLACKILGSACPL